MGAGDERAVSPLLGAILLAGIFVLGLSVVQTQAVPALNEGVEFDHAQRVAGDMERLQSAITAVGTTGSARTVTIELGTSYPQRFVLRNLAPDPSGSLATESLASVVINNTTATAETADYWNGSRQNRSTRPIVYEPNYNHLDDPPTTIYENGIVYNQFDTANVTVTGQNLVDGRRITILTIAGNLSTSNAREESVTLRPVSAIGSTVSVSNATGDRITLSVPTRLSNSTWSELLEPEYVGNGGYIVEQSYRAGTPYNRLTLTFEQGVTYELQLANVGVGTGVSEPGKEYVTFARVPDATVDTGTSHRVVVEVRDRYNNPVSGIQVNASPTARFTDATAETDADGRAAFEYTASNSAGTDGLAFDIAATPTAFEEATVSVDVTSTSEGSAAGPEPTEIDTNVTGSSGEDVRRGTVLNLTATINDTGRGGTDVLEAEWWSNKTEPNGGPGSGTALSPIDGEFDSPVEDVADDPINTSSWDLGLHNISVRGKDGEGLWGVGQYEINLVKPSADNVQVVDAAKTGSTNQSVIFTLENTGGSDATIRNITVDSAAAGGVSQIGNGSSTGTYTDEGPELRSNNSGSLLDTPTTFDFGTPQGLNSTSTVSTGSNTEYTLGEFRKNNGNEADPGTSVTVTLGFSDGSAAQVTLSL